jgi:hypothetical protein
VVHHHGLQEGHRALRRPGLRRRAGGHLRARPGTRPAPPEPPEEDGPGDGPPPRGPTADQVRRQRRDGRTSWPSACSTTTQRPPHHRVAHGLHARRRVVQANSPQLDDFLRRWNEADRKRPSSTSCGAGRAARRAARARSARRATSTPSTSSATSSSTARRSPAASAPSRCASATSTRSSAKARAVLDALLDKYADEGLAPPEDLHVLRSSPFARWAPP